MPNYCADCGNPVPNGSTCCTTITPVSPWHGKSPEESFQAGLLRAAEIARGQWHDWSNTLSPEYILRHKIAEAIEAAAKGGQK